MTYDVQLLPERLSGTQYAALERLEDACGLVLYPRANARWWLVWDGKHPVAYAGLKTKGKYLDGGSCYLCRSGVAKRARGQGLQRRLIQARLSWAKRNGCTWACSDAHVENYWSVNNLVSCGFRLFAPDYRWADEEALYFQRGV